MSGEMRTPGVDNPDRPRKRAKDHRERTDKHTRARIQGASAHQEADATKPQENSSEKGGVQAPMTGGSSAKQKNPDRFAGDKQRGKSGRHFLLRPVQRAVTNQKEEKTDDEAGANLGPSGPQAFREAPGKKNGAGGQVAEPCGIERRNRRDCVTNREIRGTPNEVNGEKGKNDGGAVQPRARSGNWRGEVGNDGGGVRGHDFTHERQPTRARFGRSAYCCNALSLLCSLR